MVRVVVFVAIQLAELRRASRNNEYGEPLYAHGPELALSWPRRQGILRRGGPHAALSHTTGNDNTASGYCALNSNTTGIYDSASGVSALFDNTTGGTMSPCLLHVSSGVGFSVV
jgi:hypothetical protein